MSTKDLAEHPTVIVSYSWSSPEYEDRILQIVNDLLSRGTDVIFDKYDLSEGADINAYMERMKTDESISKVLIFCDKQYADKADGRQGGVGTETLIIAQEVYNELDPAGNSHRYIPIVMEKGIDEKGRKKACLPTYLAGRKYIDMTEDNPDGFEQLERFIHGKPLYAKPALGTIALFIKPLFDAVVIPAPSGSATK